MQIGDGIALGLHAGGVVGHAGGGGRVHARAVIDEIHVEAALFQVVTGEVAGELVDHRAHNLPANACHHGHIQTPPP